MSTKISKRNPADDRRQCICGKPKCNERRLQILDLVDGNHAWAKNGGFIEIRFPTSKKIKVKLIHEALRRCCDHHLNVPQHERRLTGRYTVASIHFPVSLLEAKSQRSLTLTAEEAAYFDNIAGYTGNNLKDKVNQIGKLLEMRFQNGNLDDGTSIPKHEQISLSNLYVQAPIHPGSFVDSFIAERTNFHTQKRIKRRETLSAKLDDSAHAMDESVGETELSHSIAQAWSSPEIRFDMYPPTSTTPPAKLEMKPKSTPDVYSTTNALIYLGERYVALNKEDERFYEDDGVQRMAKILFVVESQLSAQISDDTWMVKCRNAETEIRCGLFKLRHVQRDDSALCDKCATINKRDTRRESRKRNSSIDRTDPSSKAPHRYLSPGSMQKKVSKLSGELKTAKRRIARLLLKDLETKNVTFEIGDSNVHSVLENCLAYCRDNSTDLRQRVLKVFIEAAKGYDVDQNDRETQHKLEQHAEEICHEIDNYALQISKKNKRVRFNSRVLRSALAYWLQSPSAYDRMREHSIEILPSVSRLQKLQRELIPKEGRFPAAYWWIQDKLRKVQPIEEQQCPTHLVELLFDEMDLRTEVVTNIMNQQTTGFTASDGHSTIDLAVEVKRILEVGEEESTYSSTDEEKDDFYDDSKHIAKKVNLFRVRTLYGLTGNVEFFYNNGSLTGDDLLGQVLRVILLCETVGLQVNLLVSDAGGPNAGLLTALRENQLLAELVWLSDELVSFQHPFFPERRIMLCPCTVHGQKACRNNLHRSREGGSRNFVKNGVKWGWHNIVDIYNEDIANGPPPSTRLTKQCIEPDRYSKMGVKEALAPFQYETIIFALNRLVEILPNCLANIFVLDEEVLNLGGGQSASTNGYAAEKLDRCLEIVTAEVDKERNHKDYPMFLSRLSAVDYMVTIHGIFTARFVSTEAVLVKSCGGNRRAQKQSNGKTKFFLQIDEEERRMKAYLEHLEEWRQESLKLKEEGFKGWERTFLSATTYKNLRLSICGYLCYARVLLNLPGGPIYVPYSHANQSSIECVFSQSRGMKRDTAATFPKGILAIEANRDLDTRTLERGGVYDSDLVRAGEEDNAANILDRRDKAREEELQEWIATRKRIGIGCSETVEHVRIIKSLPISHEQNQEEAKHPTPGRIAELIENNFESNRLHLSEILIQDDDFCGMAKASIFGEAQSFYKNLFTLPDEWHEQHFDCFCQVVYQHLTQNFDEMLTISKRTRKGMHQRLLGYLHSPQYNHLAQTMIPELQCRLGLGAVVLTLQRHLLDHVDRFRKAIAPEQRIESIGKAQKSKKEIKLLVNRFVGFGLAGLIQRLKLQLENDMENDIDDDETHTQLALARRMRIFHDAALMTPGYLEECYDKNQALKNDGYLALLSPQFFGFGEALMSVVDKFLHPDMFSQDGAASLEKAEQSMLEELPTLIAVFHSCCDFCFTDDSDNSEEEKKVSDEARKEMVKIILSKTAHSYFNAHLKVFQQGTVKRKGKEYTATTFRGRLKTTGLKKNDTEKTTSEQIATEKEEDNN